MAKCTDCGSETELYSSGVPICLKCSDERESKASKKPPGRGQSIRSLLVDDIAKATARADKASQAFMEVMGQIPQRLPASRWLSAYLQRLT
jgi:hypothetical protein